MSSIESKTEGGAAVPFMADFVPLSQLWTGPNAPYPTEYSARWAVGKLRTELASAQAMAMHRKRLMVHPVRFAQVAEKAALKEFSDRAAKA